jgi:2-keto-4-pentenoate hydratase
VEELRVEPTVRDDLVSLLFEARQAGKPGLNLAAHGLDRESALDLQLAVLERFLAAGDTLAGWKVEFTAGAARDRLGAGYRPFGYILGSHVFTNGSHIGWSDVATGATVRADAEICLILGHDVIGAIDRDEARAVVAEIVPAFELTQRRRTPDCDDATVLADGCANWGIVTGGAGSPPTGPLSTIAVRLLHDGAVVQAREPGHVMDDPFASLASLSTSLARHGQTLRAGQRVITGAFVTTEVGPGTWHAELEGVGEVTVTFD